jgi:hypothetical protein
MGWLGDGEWGWVAQSHLYYKENFDQKKVIGVDQMEAVMPVFIVNGTKILPP